MLSRLLNKVRRGKGTNTEPTNTPTKQYRYRVTMPGQLPVVLRAANQQEVKAMVREANGLTRLPAGTKVERLAD